MDDLLREFLAETGESLDKVDTELVRFEQEPNNAKILDNIFRLLHTIKGTCGFLGLPRLETLAHAAETLMSRFRDGMPVRGEAVSLILATIDQIKDILGELERAQREPPGEDSELIARLERMTSAIDRSEPIAETPLPRRAQVAEEEHAPETGMNNGTIRVAVDTIEKLMTLVSELVLTRNQLFDVARRAEDAEFKLPLARLSSVTAELQEGVTKTRMQPIGHAWQKLPRLVRDLAAELGKEIELHMVGADTELDRQVLELIKDPLTHMVRNAADHGLETLGERRALGKPEKGQIRLSAHHEGGHIIIEIADDGRGLNHERIRAKAVSLGLASEAALEEMSDAQVQKLIFTPGFSTAAQITSISGRGVGMDVVKTNIDQIGGTIDVRSTIGEGSRFTIKIPLTLAIVSALLIETGGERFAIPQLAVVEVVPTRGDSEHRIDSIAGSPVLRLRDQLLPLFQLSMLLGDEARPLDGIESGFIVITQVGRQRFGLIVDSVVQTEEIVVKPLSRKLRHIGMFSGTTILGDGSVVLILDPNGVAELLGSAPADAVSEVLEQGKGLTDNGSNTPLLLFRAVSETLKAVPVALLTRLEEIDCERMERADGMAFIQYHGRLMPLLEFSGETRALKAKKRRVLVFSNGGRSMGLLVDEIVDIAEGALHIDVGSATPGILGSAIVNGTATEILDVCYWLSQAFFDDISDAESSEAEQPLLLVEDSEFFRALLQPVLNAAGYSVTALPDAGAALMELRGGKRFRAVISDLDMPGMNGLQFAQAVRADGRFAELPLIAIAPHAGAALRDEIRKAGFSEFVAKFDRSGLLAAVRGATMDRLKDAA